MRISFVRPHLFDGRASDALEPLVFAILAALTPGDVELSLFDERRQPLPEGDLPDLAALTVETFTAKRAYQIARDYRRRGVRVVMGGYHPTFLPHEALRFADAVVIGDAEDVWPHVVADARRGALRRVYRGGTPTLRGVRFDRSIFGGTRYPPVASVQYGRGCRYACDFCSIHAFYGSSVRYRPAEELCAEIAALGRRWVLIVDDNLFVNREAALELFGALGPLRVRWGCQISLDVAGDAHLLDAMAESGCMAALVGFESIESGNLRQMRKSWNLRGGPYREAIRRFHDRGIMVYGSFVFGYDSDTRDTIARTVDFALEAGLFLVNFSALTPTPGSRLYERLQRERRLLYPRWWLDERYRYGDTVFQPRHLTPPELTHACAAARQAFYRPRAIAARACGAANRRTPHHAALFAFANLISRRELASKLGHRLGAPLDPGDEDTFQSAADVQECCPC